MTDDLRTILDRVNLKRRAFLARHNKQGEKPMMDEQVEPKTMRFYLPSSQAIATFPNLGGLRIVGEYRTDNRTLALKLIESAGPLRWDRDEALGIGITDKALTKIGYPPPPPPENEEGQV